MKELTFNVTLEEANLILEGLGKLPFEKVFAVINKLQEQAQSQVNADSNGKSEPVKGEKLGIPK